MILNLIIIITVLIIIDVYGYFGIRKLFGFRWLKPWRKTIVTGYFIMDAGFILFSLVWGLIIRNSGWADYIKYRSFFYITGGFLLIFLPKILFLVFNLIHDIWVIIRYLLRKVGFIHTVGPVNRPSWILSVGFICSLLMFLWVVQGIGWGRHNFKVENVEVPVPNLPDAFDGFRIIQISDTHLGSFPGTQPIEKAVRLMKETPHDVLFFTGDMVNNEAVEAEKFVEAFASISSPEGKFSILGNHDMGDYRRWYTIEEKSANLEQLMDFHAQMGFDLLRNDHRFVVRGDDSLMIAGVDNWGLPPFAQLGDIDKALGAERGFHPTILLSHDPSHWTEEVIPLTNIFLTLSGHTHAMQAGIRTPWFSWSPVSLKYPHWNGLYKEDGQFLYVNRGLGYLGFPGRLGMPPEITLITLRKE